MKIEIKEKVNLGMQLRVNRVKKGYSIEGLSKKCGMNRQTVYVIEKNGIKNLDIEKVIILAKTLGISLEELIVEREIGNAVQ